jgi:hypothetical protein
VQNDQIEVLLKEYDALRAEINIANTQYRRTVGLSYLYLPALVTATGIFSSAAQNGSSSILAAMKSSSAQELWLCILSLAILMGFSLFANALDSLSMMLLMGTRCARIEQRINQELGGTFLEWDSRVLPRWFSASYIGKGLWIKPQVLLAAWTFLFVGATNAFLCVIAFIVAPHYSLIFSISVAVITLFNILQWLLTFVTGAAEMRRIINSPGDEPSRTIVSFELSSETTLAPTLREAWPIVLVSVVFGPLPLALCAILTNSFWPSSPHPFPFLKILSVALGDSLLLPVFNAYAFRLFRLYARRLSVGTSRLGFYVMGTIVAALGGQYWLHSAWASDQYTGFMDLTKGAISVAGWWHLIYAGLETTVVLTYLFIWITSIAVDGNSHRVAATGWRWFVAYCSLGIVDLVLHWRTAFVNLRFFEVLRIESPNLIKLLLALVILDLFRRAHRGLRSSSETSEQAPGAAART